MAAVPNVAVHTTASPASRSPYASTGHVDIAKAPAEHVRAVRRDWSHAATTSRARPAPCSGVEVLSEVRVAVAGRPNRCGDRRPARGMRELATGGDALPHYRSGALQRRAPDEPPAPILGARPVQHAGHRSRLCGRRRTVSDADWQALSGARYTLHERLAPSARPTTRNASTDATASAVATRRTGAAAGAEVTVRTMLQQPVGSVPWSGDLASLDSVILPLVMDHSENLSTPPGGASAKWLQRAVRARASAAPCMRGRAAWRPRLRRSARRTRRARR